MIATNIESNIFGALQILNFFCVINCLIDALLSDEEMEESKMWMMSCLQNDVFRHSSQVIRKSIARITRGIIRLA
jgi:hypothetical protein